MNPDRLRLDRYGSNPFTSRFFLVCAAGERERDSTQGQTGKPPLPILDRVTTRMVEETVTWVCYEIYSDVYHYAGHCLNVI